MRKRAVLLPVLLAFLVGAEPALAWTWPADGPVLQLFTYHGDPYGGGQHRGIDIGTEPGANVRAPRGGIVTFAGAVPQGGRTLTISTEDGLVVTLLRLGELLVARGDAVAEGDVVAAASSSGESELPGTFVHLGVRVAADPAGYLDPLDLLPSGAGAGRTEVHPPVHEASPVAESGAQDETGAGPVGPVDSIGAGNAEAPNEATSAAAALQPEPLSTVIEEPDRWLEPALPPPPPSETVAPSSSVVHVAAAAAKPPPPAEPLGGLVQPQSFAVTAAAPGARSTRGQNDSRLGSTEGRAFGQGERTRRSKRVKATNVPPAGNSGGDLAGNGAVALERNVRPVPGEGIEPREPTAGRAGEAEDSPTAAAVIPGDLLMFLALVGGLGGALVLARISESRTPRRRAAQVRLLAEPPEVRAGERSIDVDRRGPLSPPRASLGTAFGSHPSRRYLGGGIERPCRPFAGDPGRRALARRGARRSSAERHSSAGDRRRRGRERASV